MTATETSARWRDGFLADAAETRFVHPAFLDALAAGRQVVVFDDRGTSRSTGEAPGDRRGPSSTARSRSCVPWA